MVSPKNPASATAANPANATRRPGFGKESSEKPAASSRPSFSTHPSDQSEARIRGTGGNGSFKFKFKFNARHFEIWVRTHLKFKRNFKSIEVGIWFRTHPKCKFNLRIFGQWSRNWRTPQFRFICGGTSRIG
uniref:Uncharacterized protein n=1 Tax=Globisporangium ultimum (strain ATCC 200006 / CBS 805.95 / DAOM BR144) TaxID=431595 RepID=K3XDI4_GLOUD